MEADQHASRPASLEQTVKGTSASRPRAAINRDGVRSGTANKQLEETKYPSTLPKAFQGMLKTTTETGDIGLFSIKPPRLPPLNSPGQKAVVYNENTRKPQQSPHPFGVPRGDDRHRLPSYARDASSEVISMYETASQKSGRRDYDDTDYRSYSMTQNSLSSSYTLSANRSYASLRSQPDGLGLIQRPRSPFAYPARLKRPGFRPSSPALTDDGVIDYSKRVGIERVSIGQNPRNSSPSSLYAHRRKPPLSLRNEANRSTTYLLSQPSSPSCPPSPSHRHGTEIQGNDWQRRTFPVSVKTSPTRSVICLASTVNKGGVRTPVFTITTPGKVPPPSPLYYDYTEDFEDDDYGQSGVLPPPPAFRIDESIPKYPPLSVKKGATAIIVSETLETSLKPCGDVEPFPTFASNEDPLSSNGKVDTSIVLSPTRSCGTAAQKCQILIGPGASKRDTSVIRLSGLGYGARQLSSHVEEAFGLPSSPPFEIEIQNSDNPGVKGHLAGAMARDQVDEECESDSVRSSSHLMNIDIEGILQTPDVPGSRNSSKGPNSTERKNIAELNRKVCESERDLQQLDSVMLIPGYVERNCDQLHHVSFAPKMSVDQDNLKMIESIHKEAELITATDKRSCDVKNLGWAQECTTSHVAALLKCPAKINSSPHSTPDHNIYLDELQLSHLSSRISRGKCSKQHSEEDKLPKLGIKAHVENLSAPDLPKFDNQKLPGQFLCRSESPMLAPKPISPARQLKLKSSVPQLMKALPPPPPDPPTGSNLLPRHFLTTVRADLPFHLPSLTPNNCKEQKRKQNSADESMSRRAAERRIALYKPDNANELISKLDEFGGSGIITTQAPVITSRSTQVPKLKLKWRHDTTSEQSFSSWSIDQEDRRPCSGSALHGQLSGSDTIENSKAMKPKFKLKVTRASNSTQGTLRIHRGSGESRPLTGLQLQNTKDLFTPNSGRDSVIGRVGKHFQLRKMTPSQSSRPSSGSANTSTFSSMKWHSAENAITSRDITARNTQRFRGNISNSPEARNSFSDGVLVIKKRNKLGTKLSNWEFRIAVPYISKAPNYHCDDTQSDPTATSNDINSSFLGQSPNLLSTDASGIFRPIKRVMRSQQTQKMRSKIREWLREARSAISDHVKLRSHIKTSDDETTQLTTKL